MSPAEIIRRARALDLSFTEERHPPTVAFEFFTKAFRSLMGLIGREQPKAVMEMAAFDLPSAATWEAGITLSADPGPGGDPIPINYTQIHSYAIHQEGPDGTVLPGEDLMVVPFAQRYTCPFRRAATMAGHRLFFIGSPEEWRGYREVRVFYTPSIPAPEYAARNAELELPLPPTAFDVLIDHVAMLMALRAGAEAQQADWGGMLDQSRAALLEELSRRQGGETWHVAMH